MKDIKIRAWHKIEKRFYYKSIFDLNWYSTPFNDSEGCHTIGLMISDDRTKLIPMEYTGLKDKNGKGEELYDQDLITNINRNEGKPHVIEWNDMFGGWVGSYHGLSYLIAQELNEIKKVGNIYQNKNLIES